MSKLNYLVKFFSQPSRCLGIPLAILLTLGIDNSQTKPVSSSELQPSAKSQMLVRAEAFGADNAITIRGKLPEVDGVYLYGQSPEPQQIGHEYIIIEVNKGKAVGAFYLPNSEFNCFNGTIEAGKLALLLANGPETEAYPEELGNNTDTQQVVAALGDRSLGENGSNEITTPYSVALQNYHQLSKVSTSDKQILAACKSNYQGSGE